MSTDRLTLGRHQQNSAHHTRELALMISEEEFAAIRACVAKAFGFVANPYIRSALVEEEGEQKKVDST